MIGDRIVGATWAFAAAMTRGDVTVRGVDPHHLDLVLEKLRTGGRRGDRLRAADGFRVVHGRRPKAVDFVTLPYPGFATDLQPFAIALSAVSDGTSMITENLFEARFRFIEEMIRLGADARTDGHHAVVRGVRAAVQRAGLGLATSAPVRGWCWPGCARTGSPRSATSSTSTAVTRVRGEPAAARRRRAAGGRFTRARPERWAGRTLLNPPMVIAAHRE